MVTNMPQVQMPDGTTVDMPDTLTPELATRLKAFQAAKTTQTPSMPNSAHDVGVPPPSQSNDVGTGNIQSSSPSTSSKVIDWIHRQGEGVANLARYAGDVYHTPQRAVGKYLNSAMTALGINSPELSNRISASIQAKEDQKDQDRAKVWGPGAMATDIVANPLTYATAGGAGVAPELTAGAGSNLGKEGVELLSKSQVPGLATHVAQGAVQGNVMSTLDPNATPASVGVGTALGAAAPIATKALIPIVRGTSNMVKGMWGNAATPTVEDVLPHYANMFKGESGDAYKMDLQHNYSKDRAVWGAPFQDLRASGGVVELPKLEAGLDDTIQKLENSRGGKDEAALAKLKSLQAGLKNPDAPKDWASALDVGSDINSILSDAKHGLVPNHNLARVAGPLNHLLSEDMDEAGKASGSAYQAAKAGWKANVVPWEDPAEGGRHLQTIMRNPTPDDAMRALTMAGPNKAKILVDHASPRGIQALQSGIAETAMNEDSPKAMLNALNKREALYNLVYKGVDKARMDGYKKILGAASFVDNVIPGKWGINASQAAQKLFETEAGQNLLLGASHLNPKSRVFGEFVTDHAAKVFGGSTTPMFSTHPRTSMNEQEQSSESPSPEPTEAP